MRTRTIPSHKAVIDEGYFERKGLDLVVAEDEIEAWELEPQDFDGLSDADAFTSTARYD
jgi:hypothetical protein